MPSEDGAVLPDYTDWYCHDAVASIESLGCTPKIEDEDGNVLPSCPSDDRKVKSQKPIGGTPVDPGEVVTVIVYPPPYGEMSKNFRTLTVLGIASTLLSGAAAVFSALAYAATR